MRVSEQMVLIDKIARELQSRYRYEEIDTFLAAFGFTPPATYGGTNSKWVYSKSILRGAPQDVSLRIAKELDFPVSPEHSALVIPPKN